MKLATVVAGVAALVLAACPKGSDNKKTIEPVPGGSDANPGHLLPEDDAGNVTLGPAPPLPAVPAGLPPSPALAAFVTPEAVALGELLFFDGRIASDAKTSCATCHDPAHGYSGGKTVTSAGKPNLRRAPALVNVAWNKELGWDGRYQSLDEQLPIHFRGQLGDDIEPALKKVVDLPLYRAHFARQQGSPTDAALHALEAYVLTRYSGDSPWDRMEPTSRVPKPAAGSGSATPVDPIVAGYLVFTGKGQCGTCHVPPLYTDFGFHKTYVGTIADPGRGKVDPKQDGAMKTPTLRGVASRPAFFHDGSKTSLDGVLDAYAANPDLKITLTAQERSHLLAFLAALSPPSLPAAKPILP